MALRSSSVMGISPTYHSLGPRGYINSNPILSLRQLGYLVENPPKEKMLEASILHDLETENPTMFKKIEKAWGKINRKGKAGPRKKDCIVREPYCQWIRERIQFIKFPFSIEIPIPHTVIKPTHVPKEEVEELKSIIFRLEKDNKKLKLRLRQVTFKKNEPKFDLSQKEK